MLLDQKKHFEEMSRENLKVGTLEFELVEQVNLSVKIVNFKGQLISKCPFGVIVWTKIPTKFFPGFLP